MSSYKLLHTESHVVRAKSQVGLLLQIAAEFPSKSILSINFGDFQLDFDEEWAVVTVEG